MMRLAYFSPLNPAPSGIADYSEELLPYLRAFAEITLVVDGYTPSNRAIAEQFRVVDVRDYHAAEHDLALYQMGNSPAHAYIYRRALAEPGIVVLHDLVLHHLVAWLTLNRGDTAGYAAAMQDAYGAEGARLAEREALGLEGLDRFAYPLSERVAQTARGVIVHSRYVGDRVKRMAPDVPVAQIPHEMPPIAVQDPAAARAALGLASDALLVGTFGNLGPAKRTPILLEAVQTVRERFPKLELALVGAVSPNLDLEGLCELLGLKDAVRMLGHLPFARFQTAMAAMDVCVNLRYPTAGETSGAVLRMMAQAKPVVVSNVGWFAELPSDAVAKIDVDDHEVALLTETLTRLLENAPLRAALGAQARAYVVRECDAAFAAQSYADFMDAVLAGRAVSRVYAPPRAHAGDAESEPKQSVISESGTTAPAGAPLPASESNAAPTLPRVPADWRDEVAYAYRALGLEENDATLTEVARAIVELGLGESASSVGAPKGVAEDAHSV